MTNTKQYSVDVNVKLIVTVDEDETTLDEVIADMDYDFNVHPETDHAEIVTTEIRGYDIADKKDDTILI